MPWKCDPIFCIPSVSWSIKKKNKNKNNKPNIQAAYSAKQAHFRKTSSLQGVYLRVTMSQRMTPTHTITVTLYQPPGSLCFPSSLCFQVALQIRTLFLSFLFFFSPLLFLLLLLFLLAPAACAHCRTHDKTQTSLLIRDEKEAMGEGWLSISTDQHLGIRKASCPG